MAGGTFTQGRLLAAGNEVRGEEETKLGFLQGGDSKLHWLLL